MRNDTDNTDRTIHVVVSSTFVAEPVQKPLEAWTRQLGMAARVSFAPYNQVFQQLLNPASLLAGNGSGLNVILLRLSDWNGNNASESPVRPAAPHSELRRNVVEFVEALRRLEQRGSGSTLVITCPESHAGDAPEPQGDSLQEMEKFIVSGFSDSPGVEVVTAQDFLTLYPVADCFDPHADKLAHIPYSSLLYTCLGTLIARRLYAVHGPRYKVIALDCDGTLWDGVCGEDGPEGIRIDSIRKELQASMLAQRDRGMLICLCSRNNEQDVLEVFRRRNDMILREEHIAARRVNWKSKTENLKSLSNELGLHLDSFIFIDDDPVVCAELRARRPEVLTLQLPGDRNTIPVFLKHIWAFDGGRATAENHARTRLYHEHLMRESVRHRAPTLRDFLAGLDLNPGIAAVRENEFGRLAELTVRTNQFNLTGKRRSEREIRQCLDGGLRECFVVHLKDRFGDYGLVGAVIFATTVDSISVDTFLLSCRALGRGVEHRMMARLGEIAKERGKAFVDVSVVPTEKNRPALDFVNALPKAARRIRANGFEVRLPAEEAASMTYDPDADPIHFPEGSGSLEARPPSDGSPGAAFLGSIPEALHTPQLIHDWIHLKNLRSHPSAAAGPEENPIESRIAAIFSDLLGVATIGIHDSFFDLGGHSLLAMQALSRIRQAFNVELDPIVLFTTAFTPADLSSAVQKEQLRQMNPQDVEGILKKLAEITDEDAEDL